MAVHTRFYPTVIRPHVGRFDGALLGTWTAGIGYQPWYPWQNVYMASSSKTDGGALTSRIYKTNQQGDYDVHTYSWLIGPLNAQTVSGVYEQCFAIWAQWLSPSPTAPAASTVVAYKVHAYITQGYSAAVRHTLIDSYVDTGFFPGPFDTSLGIFLGFDTSPTMVSGAALSGDYIKLEIGFRVVSSPTPAPNYYPTETWASEITFRNMTGTTTAGVAQNDAVQNTDFSVAGTNIVSWFNFANGLDLIDSPPAAPANDTCATAVVISALPYDSPRIDTSQASGTEREVWYEYTAASTGTVQTVAFPSTYPVTFAVFTGTCGAPFQVSASGYFSATAGTTYRIRIRNSTSGSNAIRGGGSLAIRMFYRELPAQDDVYLPSGTWLVAYRNGYPVNAFDIGATLTGIAIDYSLLPMTDINLGGTNTEERVLLGLHDFEIIEIFRLIDFGGGNGEVDFIGDPWNVPIVSIHPATLQIRRSDNRLLTGWFGNGYLYILGEGPSGTDRPAVLNTVSNNADYSAIKEVGVAQGDSQAGAPFTDTLYYPSVEITAAWAISLDEVNNVVYFTSAGYYAPVGGQQVRTYNIATGVTSVFATLAARPTSNPGLKGLQYLPGGGVLVCNADVVQRLDSSGAVIGTFTPSIPSESQDFGDVKLTVDATQFWAVDVYTSRLFLVDLATMAEVATYATYQGAGALVQMAIYQPSGVTGTPPGTSTEGTSADESCPDTFLVDPPGKPLPRFLHDRGFLVQSQPATNVPVTLGNAPAAALRPRFRG